ncbi:preprotein translocase subunit SecA [bacterium]|jgi:preprotein translocase subunit SecA|nr:preprotein translocase subunit SecA [bacterium]MDP6571256.1 preprotein translocase subunit SecA [Patescibacteria group bacterium]|tara:strand:+ start:45302 stop:48148 length:2847 start_codon:yes stop_codon:yes gene_type:complete
MSFLDKLLGDPGDRQIKKKMQPIVAKINSLEPEFKSKTDEELKGYTEQFKLQLKEGKTLDDILPQAFAVVREAAKRALGMRHFDVQLIGGMVLHQGNIAEMRTGEGKTMMATLAVYLNALSGKGVHVVTVNDYLARRDAVWMGKIYDFLGLSIGTIQHEKSYIYDAGVKAATDKDQEQDSEASSPLVEIDYDHLRPAERRQAYEADITYGTNNEFGFDYLRDNMVADADQMVQRDFNFAIVDEVDSILIDEARTPLIISAPDNRPIDEYYKYAKLVTQLKENEDYNVDEKLRASTLSEAGIKKMEKALGMENIYTEGGLGVVHHLEQALKANTLFEKDKDYVIKDNEVVIVDEFTGRMMQGRRYSEGLHQAIEAKENVEIKRESRTLATITFQNYFRTYPKLSGMTGTAKTEEEEFRKIYGLDVFVIPTNKPIARIDSPDRVYKSRKGKYEALIKEIKKINDKGQPILVGTVSIEQNEEFDQLLKQAGIKHEVLNAKNHEREAEIIAQAGAKGSVTLATNMAGRGVDIVLGGAPFGEARANEVKKLGGLYVLGTDRHEARRIDNQLRGRGGRQGDPGASQFFISVEDDLMRIFGSDRIKNMMNRLGVPEDMPIENKMVSKSIESAQKKVEGNNFDIRKHVVEYDDVMNHHREAIYKQRRGILKASDEEGLREQIFDMIDKEVQQVVNLHAGSENHQQWNLKEIEQTMQTIFPPDTSLDIAEVIKPAEEKDKGKDAEMRSKLIDHITDKAEHTYDEMIKSVGDDQEQVKKLERAVLLNSIDTLWMDHLDALDNLRTAVGLRGYGQRDPLVEYKRDAYGLFQQLQGSIQNQVVYSVFKILAARGVQSQIQNSPEQAQRLLNTLGSSLSALQGLRFSAPAKTMSHGTESPMAQSSQSGTQPAAVVSQDQSSSSSSSSVETASRNRFDGEKVGRNDACPCGSGKKFKKCHGK